MTERPVVTVEVAALLLGEDEATVRRLADEGQIELVHGSDGSVDVCMASLNELTASRDG